MRNYFALMFLALMISMCIGGMSWAADSAEAVPNDSLVVKYQLTSEERPELITADYQKIIKQATELGINVDDVIEVTLDYDKTPKMTAGTKKMLQEKMKNRIRSLKNHTHTGSDGQVYKFDPKDDNFHPYNPLTSNQDPAVAEQYRLTSKERPELITAEYDNIIKQAAELGINLDDVIEVALDYDKTPRMTAGTKKMLQEKMKNRIRSMKNFTQTGRNGQAYKFDPKDDKFHPFPAP